MRMITLAAAAVGLAAATPAAAQIVNVSALNGTGTTVSLAAGTYTVSLAGIADGGAYDAWSPWGASTGCDANGANCSQGYLNAFAIDFGFGTGSFTGVDGFQFGYVPTPGNSGLYASAALALAAYRTLQYSYAPLPVASDSNAYTLAPSPYSFTLAAAQEVRFFVLDSPYGDNRDGYSVRLTAATQPGAVPEPATWAMMLAGFGMLGFALRRRPTQRVRFV